MAKSAFYFFKSIYKKKASAFDGILVFTLFILSTSIIVINNVVIRPGACP